MGVLEKKKRGRNVGVSVAEESHLGRTRRGGLGRRERELQDCGWGGM